MSLSVFILSHDPARLSAVPYLPEWSQRILLGGLRMGNPDFQDNSFGEGRLFLSDLEPPEAEYVGQLNARTPTKYPWLKVDWPTLDKRVEAKIGPDVVLAPWPTDKGSAPTQDWSAFSEFVHPGMWKLLEEMSCFTGMGLAPNLTLWANDFVCARAVWLDFRHFYREVVNHFFYKYGARLPFSDDLIDISRKPAYFYERVASLYFANQSKLKIVQL